jgi:Tfp pilus assembly protein PilP
VLGLVGAGVVACGEDDPPPPPPKPAGGGGGAAPKPAAKKPGGKPAPKLQPRQQIEQRVVCPSPEKATGAACQPETPSCEPGLFCLPVGKGHHCEPCAERDSIRHEFKERDFVADLVRDPFQSFVIIPKGLDAKSIREEDLGPCRRASQLVATSYSYQELRLVGIVAQGTQRKVLMMDRANLGHIIRRGDCVGKEKAVVKDIGTGYVTFQIFSEANDKGEVRPPEERSVLLHPKSLQAAEPDQPEPAASTVPIVVPPTTTGPNASDPAAPSP